MYRSEVAEVPAIIGVGQCRGSRDSKVRREPMELLREASAVALRDAGVGGITSLRTAFLVVEIDSWLYDDPAGEWARSLGVEDATYLVQSDVGGNQPLLQIERAAAMISQGEVDLVLVGGAESTYSRTLFEREGVDTPWSRRPGGPRVHPRDVGGSERMWKYGTVLPIRNYPLFENGFLHATGMGSAQGAAESAMIYSHFSEVALKNEGAWDRSMRTESEILTISGRNRLVCHPYPLLVNANQSVDQAAVVLLASERVLLELGGSPQGLVFPHASCGASDARDIYLRPTFASSPGLEKSIAGALHGAEIDAVALGLIDLYACFPIVPKLAARALGRPTSDQLTVTGGLSSFGGPWNNYSMHAVVGMVGELRGDDSRPGLVYATGEYLTKHHALVLSRERPRRGFVREDGAVGVGGDAACPEVVENFIGRAEVETFTVEFDREGAPKRGFVVALDATGRRIPATTQRGDVRTLHELVARDGSIGRWGDIRVGDDGRNIFELSSERD